MGLIILLAFIGIPALEIGLFIEVGGEIGALNTVLLIVLTAIIGAGLFRYQGLNVLRRVQESVNAGEVPLADGINGVGLLLAGALLMIPGFFTDAVGFLLFVPPVRILLLAWLLKNMLSGSSGVRFHHFGARGGYGHSREDIIDGEYQDLTPHGEPRSATPEFLPPEAENNSSEKPKT